MRGRLDQDFMKNINKEFICLVASVMQFSLKMWSTGKYRKPDRFRGTIEKCNHHGPNTGGKD